MPLFDRDESHFAQAARQMVETGDYWQICFQDLPRHLKTTQRLLAASCRGQLL